MRRLHALLLTVLVLRLRAAPLVSLEVEFSQSALGQYAAEQTLTYDAAVDDEWTAVVEFCDRTFDGVRLAAFHHTVQCVEQCLDGLDAIDPPGRERRQAPPPPPQTPFWTFALNPKARLATASFSARHPAFRLFVHDPDECQGISGPIAARGYYDGVKTVRLARALEALGPRAELLDVGAHVGWFSLLAAAHGHRTTAIEPMRYNLELLNASLAINAPHLSALVTLVPVAVSDTDSSESSRGGDAMCLVPTMNAGGHNSGNAQLVPQAAGDGCAAEERDVPLRRLDAVVSPEAWARVEVVKFDIEGHEGRAWRGLAGLLAQHTPCLVFVEVYHGTGAQEALDDAMVNHGYRLFAQAAVASEAELSLEAVRARGDAALPENDYELRHGDERCRVLW